MANIAVVLKDEIRRLARKEVKSHLGTTRRVTARYRSDIATLKRLVQLQERELALLASNQAKRPKSEEAPADAAPGSRFSARSVRAQRKRLKLTAEEYAKLIGVSTQTVYLWERGKVRPKTSQFAALVSVRSLGRREARTRLEQPEPKAARKARPRRKKLRR